MGQDDVYKLLKKENRWLTTKEVSEMLNVPYTSVHKSLTKLHGYGDLERRAKNESRRTYEYKIRRINFIKELRGE